MSRDTVCHRPHLTHSRAIECVTRMLDAGQDKGEGEESTARLGMTRAPYPPRATRTVRLRT